MAAGKTALELLTPDPDRIPSVFETAWLPTAGAVFGFVTVCIVNWGTRRPPLSGIQKHILATVGGAAFCKFLDEKTKDYLAHRDAMLRYYIETHPDDFVTPERRKYADVFNKWVPIR